MIQTRKSEAGLFFGRVHIEWTLREHNDTGLKLLRLKHQIINEILIAGFSKTQNRSLHLLMIGLSDFITISTNRMLCFVGTLQFRAVNNTMSQTTAITATILSQQTREELKKKKNKQQKITAKKRAKTKERKQTEHKIQADGISI